LYEEVCCVNTALVLSHEKRHVWFLKSLVISNKEKRTEKHNVATVRKKS